MSFLGHLKHNVPAVGLLVPLLALNMYCLHSSHTISGTSTYLAAEPGNLGVMPPKHPNLYLQILPPRALSQFPFSIASSSLAPLPLFSAVPMASCCLPVFSLILVAGFSMAVRGIFQKHTT